MTTDNNQTRKKILERFSFIGNIADFEPYEHSTSDERIYVPTLPVAVGLYLQPTVPDGRPVDIRTYDDDDFLGDIVKKYDGLELKPGELPIVGRLLVGWGWSAKPRLEENVFMQAFEQGLIAVPPKYSSHMARDGNNALLKAVTMDKIDVNSVQTVLHWSLGSEKLLDRWKWPAKS